MDADDLTCNQAENLRLGLQPLLGYLARLRKRIEVRGFPPDDKLRQLVERAHSALIQLEYDLAIRSALPHDRKRHKAIQPVVVERPPDAWP